MKKINPKNLIGKTITNITKKKLVEYDDTGFLELEFSDGVKVLIVSAYKNWTSESLDEYPTDIYITDKIKHELEDLKNRKSKTKKNEIN
jgi:hypothetical protein